MTFVQGACIYLSVGMAFTLLTSSEEGVQYAFGKVREKDPELLPMMVILAVLAWPLLVFIRVTGKGGSGRMFREQYLDGDRVRRTLGGVQGQTPMLPFMHPYECPCSGCAEMRDESAASRAACAACAHAHTAPIEPPPAVGLVVPGQPAPPPEVWLRCLECGGVLGPPTRWLPGFYRPGHAPRRLRMSDRFGGVSETQCKRHGRQPFEGAVVCTACGFIWQVGQPDEDDYMPDVCECGAVLLPEAAAASGAPLETSAAEPLCARCDEEDMQEVEEEVPKVR